MLTANDIIHGWSPAGDDDVEVNVSQDMCLMAIKPITQLSTTLSPLSSVTHTPVASSSDRRAQRNRYRDPSWIPRPRNAFIIFRCEYSREHAQGPQGPHPDPGSATSVKTLSKRAAEAWKQLSASEKQRYKILADREREEHARLYPHYRFRPMKRQASGERSRSRPLVEPTEVSALMPPLLAAPYHEPPSGCGLIHDDLERAQALEAYAIGLYNHGLFSPFSFPEY